MKTTKNDIQLNRNDLDVLMDCLELTVADLDINDKNPELLEKARRLYGKIWNIYAIKLKTEKNENDVEKSKKETIKEIKNGN